MDQKEFANSEQTLQIQQGKKTSIFSYAPNLPVSVRIVAFLFFLAGAIEVGFALMGFLKPMTTNIIYGVLLLVLSNGLARLKKWAIVLYLIAIIFGFISNPLSGVVALVLALFVVSNYKRFE